jgi:predicted AAA+ superfamily ATPase
MKRSIINELEEWKNSKKRLPIVLYGARQVGKTYTVLDFGKKNYKNVIHINFDKNDAAKRIFEQDLDIDRIILELEALINVKIDEDKTLLFFDEIQSAPKVLSSLKYFAEDRPQYNVIAAGSLLGVAINREQYSFPVGKVKTLQLYPFSFEEFLESQNEGLLLKEIRKHCETQEKLVIPLHLKALKLFQTFLIVGGMPASINAYNNKGSLLDVKPVLQQINSDYISDMGKYASTPDTVKIRATFNSMPHQLAKPNKRFQYKVVSPSANSQKYATAIEWLEFAGLALKCKRISTAEIPLKVYEDVSAFKLYMHDIGIVSMLSETPLSAILGLDSIDNTFLGALIENFVAITLSTLQIPLRYWESKATAEVDFILQNGEKIIPIEVKKGLRSKSKSLSVYRDFYKPELSIKVSSKNFGKSDGLLSLPLYALETWLKVSGF